jgi:hypothetical protein
MNKLNKKQWVILIVWFVCHLIVLQFFRFKFGLNKTSIASGLFGMFLLWLARNKKISPPT